MKPQVIWIYLMPLEPFSFIKKKNWINFQFPFDTVHLFSEDDKCRGVRINPESTAWKRQKVPTFIAWILSEYQTPA